MKHIYGAQKVNSDTGAKGMMYYFTNRKKAVKFIKGLIELEEEIMNDGIDESDSTTLIHGAQTYYGVVERLLIHS